MFTMAKGGGFLYRIIDTTSPFRAVLCNAPAALHVGRVVSSSSSSSERSAPTLCGTDRTCDVRQLRGVVFDMDGTLTVPTLDFAEMKRRIDVPLTSDILAAVQAMPAEQKARSMAIIEEMEDEANRRLQLQPGVLDVLHFLAQHGLVRALMTRNSDKSVRVFVEHVSRLCESNAHMYPLFSQHQQSIFSQIITREFQPCKPDPAPILHVCEKWSVDPSSVVMVGDDKVDMECGRSAGAVTVLLANKHNALGHAEHADHTITSLHDLITLLTSEMTVCRNT